MYSLKRTLFLSFLVASLIVISLFAGCIGTKKTDMVTVAASLNTLGLTLGDIPSGYQKDFEEYITEQYIETSGLMVGYKIMERYRVVYNKDNTSVIMLYLARLESPEKSQSAIRLTVEDMPSLNEIKTDKIGDESYAYEYPGEMTLNVLVFIIGDVIIQMSATNVIRSSFFEYAHIVEENINANLRY